MPATVTNKRAKRNRKRQDTTKAEVSRFAGDAYDLGRRALKGVQYLKQLINIETKYSDNTNSLACSSSGSATQITAIAQGLTGTDRIGVSIKLQSISFHYTITKHASATNTLYRVILARDNDLTTVNPTIAKILATTTSGYAHLSPYNWLSVQGQRFGVLYDSSGVLDSNTITTNQVVETRHNGHIKYSGPAAADAAEGNVFLFLISNEATNTPTLTFVCRTLFTDD